MTSRIDTRPGWADVAAGVRGAGSEIQGDCVLLIENSARGLLVDLGEVTPEEAAYELPKWDLRERAERADSEYLDALDMCEVDLDDAVMKRFAVARALAALEAASRVQGAEDVLDAAYELAVVSDSIEKKLLKRLSQMVLGE